MVVRQNFFRTMRQSFNLDGLIDDGTDAIPDTTKVVNPPSDPGWPGPQEDRRPQSQDGRVRCHEPLKPRSKPSEVEAFTQRKADLQETIAALQKEADDLKA